MPKSKLFAGAVIAVVALSAATGAALADHAKKKSVATLAGGIPNCGKGTVPIQHGVSSGRTSWSCGKITDHPIKLPDAADQL